MCSTVLFVGLAYAQAFSMQIPADLFNEYGLLISVPIGVLLYISDECCGTSSHNSLNASLHWLVRKIIKLISTCVKALTFWKNRLDSLISKMEDCNSY